MRIAPVYALVLALGPLATAARAQEEDPRARARAKVVEAERLHDEGDHQSAVERLREAYALFPSPSIHFNLGLALRGLGRYPEALFSFELFLAAAPASGPDLAGRRKEAELLVEQLRGRLASLEVVSDTPGAEVVVDGRPRGRTPLRDPILVEPGSHEILVRRDADSEPFRDRVDLPAGTRLRLRAVLGRPRAAAPPVGGHGGASLLDASAAPPPAAPTPAPLYRRWWFWTAAAALAAGTAATLLAARAGGSSRACASSCELGEFSVRF